MYIHLLVVTNRHKKVISLGMVGVVIQVWFWLENKITENQWKIAEPIYTPLQSQEILNRPVCVLDILNRVWTLLKILNIDWKFWTDSEHWLNRVWTLLKILNIDWKFWTFWTESEQILIILNIDWKFWTDSEHFK
jgi:hypothetical protein